MQTIAKMKKYSLKSGGSINTSLAKWLLDKRFVDKT